MPRIFLEINKKYYRLAYMYHHKVQRFWLKY